VLFPAWTFPELMDLPEGKGGAVVVKRYPQAVRQVAIADPMELADADTPQALELLRGYCHD
jgi:molybdenum cofactor cytidylyltransferase